jgi:hypothetical protein
VIAAKMNVRLQTHVGAAPAVSVLKEGLVDMEKAFDIIDDVFASALEKFRR